ncbi:aminopeptidase [Coniosporium tulheliwenetii]|uniref:Aminopeptidase n=1 Tax=Coniosporium tulheliwenetii TaxID=3383036 RepID=A0ACC2YYH7_9PEZI|nr:aminopeptidase [Cladosporium sp. JES 115]
MRATSAGEVTPGITALEYHQRRAKLAGALPPNSIAILAASDIKYRSGAVFYEFHQDPDFFYLTGFKEPQALAVIEKTGADEEHAFHLYVRAKDSKAELWDGARSGVQAAQDVFNADESGDINRVSSILPNMVRRAEVVYTDLPGSANSQSSFTQYLTGAAPQPTAGLPKLLQEARNTAVRPLRPLMNNLRVTKSEAEIRNMRKAGQASGRAFTEAMRQSWTKRKTFAGAENALSIHYVRNDDVLNKGDLVLVDAGGEYGGYIADITRTWPVNGKFSDAQRDLYEAILRVQRTCVSLCREDADMTLDKLHKVAENGLKDGLKQLGFNMSGDALVTLFPHHLGHYIGLDVHDSPGYPRKTPLKTGHCITIEPGIYVPNDNRWPSHFRGMGIRIEDSVCIQPENPLVFTTEAVKEVRATLRPWTSSEIDMIRFLGR